MRGEWKTEMLEHPDRSKQVEIENEQVLTSISVMIVGVVMEKNSRCYHGAYRYFKSFLATLLSHEERNSTAIQL